MRRLIRALGSKRKARASSNARASSLAGRAKGPDFVPAMPGSERQDVADGDVARLDQP